jgi:hypothetical protein
VVADEESDDAVDQLAYENGEWDQSDRELLSQLLRAEDVPYAWEATTLVVDATDEEIVDRLIEQVEASSQPVLDPDAPKVVYELGGWDEARRADLAEALSAAGVAHGWDEEDDLVVLEEDEETVDPIVERLDDDADGDGAASSAADDGADDGLAAQDAMSELFVAADRLMHDPDDHEAVLRLVDATRLTESLALPYGFTAADWDPLVGAARELRDLLEAEDADEDAVIASATDLRGHLRRYV